MTTRQHGATPGWDVGVPLATAGVLASAALLATAIALARRIRDSSAAATAAVESAQRSSAWLWDLTAARKAVAAATESMQRLHEGGA